MDLYMSKICSQLSLQAIEFYSKICEQTRSLRRRPFNFCSGRRSKSNENVQMCTNFGYRTKTPVTIKYQY